MSQKLNHISKNIDAIYPLAPMQQGLLFHTLMNPGQGMYLLQYRHVMVLDNLDKQAFQRSWNSVVERHELLRTSFVWKKQARPLQVVHKHVPLPVEFMDWRDKDSASQKQSLETLLEQERQEELAFNKAPLMRVRLIQLAENTYQFVRSYHHILMDAWCFSVIMMDFLAYYRGFSQGQEVSLPKPRPYQDFIQWLEDQPTDEHKDFWQSRLAGFESPTPLGIRQENHFSNDEVVVDAVKQLSQQQTQTIQQAASHIQITMNTLLQGAWALLLSRYSGDNDIVFGVTVAGRPTHMEGIESIVGLFINTLPLRVKIPAIENLSSWLQALQTENLVLREHETSSLTDIQQWSDINQQDIFQSLFVFENAPMDAGLSQDNLEFVVENATNRTHTNYPITVVIIPGDQLHLQITYQAKDFELSRIEKMLQHFSDLIISMSDVLLKPVSNLPKELPAKENVPLDYFSMLQEEEIQQQISWGAGESLSLCQDYISRFELQSERFPEKIAVADNESFLSYRMLNLQANILAHRLIDEGVGPDTIVAVLGDRDISFLVNILAVLKAGGAYLPLDPKHPPLRLAQVLQQAFEYTERAFIIVNEEKTVLGNQAVDLLNTKVSSEKETVIPLKMVHFNLAKQSLVDTDNPKVATHGNHLAYIIFTSGSTGKPKGVMVTREGMLNNMLGKISPLTLNENDVVAQTASQCFDISVWQFLMAPLLGAKVEILPDCISHDAARLADEIKRRNVTIFEPVPALLQGILQQEKDFKRLRWVLPTGEALPPILARQWHEKYPNIPLMNAYGPAECSDDVAFYPITGLLESHHSHVPIGKATANNQLYLLSPELTLMPVGAIGEIYISGAGVGRGYLNEPDRTAAVFLPNPFHTKDATVGERLYRTGDLARLLSDGSLQYVGRTDYQVKVRGYRIELGEIESCISEHDDINENVVITLDDPQRGTILVAYLGLDNEYLEALSENGRWSSLRAFIAQNLPEYMVPSIFVALDKLPRNMNGKVDRAQLPNVDFNQQYEASYVAPSNKTEQDISEIWQYLLGLKKVGVNDHFFELGGHSLLATQLAGQLSQLLGQEIPLKSIFDCPTIREWSEWWHEEKNNIINSLPVLKVMNKPKLLPLSFVQQRMWFLQRLEPDSASYNLPIALRLKGDCHVSDIVDVLNQLVQRHEVLRTQFIIHNQQPIQVISDNLVIDVPMNVVSDEKVLTQSLRQDAMTPFALDQAPLLRANLYKVSNMNSTEWVLSVNCHHIIADAWSLRLLIDEFCQLYNAKQRQQDVTLAAHEINYTDYALWQAQCLEEGVFDRQLDYWRQKLSGDLPTLELAYDHKRPANPTWHGARYHSQLSLELSEQLQQFSQKTKRGHYVTLLAAFELLLSSYSGQTDILIGIPIANRHYSATQSLMGCFINTLVHRAHINPRTCVNEWLAQVEQQSIAAQDNQDLPFDYLVDQLGIERQLSHNPLFQTMFNYLSGKALDVFDLEGLEIESIDNRPDTALCDFKLDVQSHDNTFILNFEYSTELFEHATVQQMAEDYARILQWVIHHPEASLEQMDLWSVQPQKVKKSFISHSETEKLTDIVDDFQYLVAHQPKQLAIKGISGTLDYAQLDKASDYLATLLLEKNVAIGDHIAICVERDLAMIVSMLAVLKVGAAYIPIDPDWPVERGAYILDHAKPILCLASEMQQAQVQAWAPNLICISPNIDFKNIDIVKPLAPIKVHPLQTAYILYTSGSTGKPKGVEVSRKNLNNLCVELRQRLCLSTDQQVLALTSYCFDISVVELLLPLTRGASIIIADKDEARDPKILEKLLETCAASDLPIHVMQATPATWNMLSTQTRCSFTDMTLISGGEALSANLAQRLLDRGGRLINGYGPTEVTVYSTYYDVNTVEQAIVPIGKPGFDIQAYVLDKQLRAVPQGVVGELYLGGENIATGYFNAPNMTATTFLANPFAEYSGARMYKTGDLVRYNAQGNLDYIGRNDFQVKLRGFRIELGEIEALLPQLDGVDNAVVILSQQESHANHEEDQLIAYWCGDEKNASVLRHHLKTHLPEYMVPAQFFWLDTLPLNSNAKVDRKALPAITTTTPVKQNNTTYVEATTQWQQRLQKHWQHLFGITTIGINDHFFESGGHSLLAARLVAILAEEYHIELPLKAIFENPILADLANEIEAKGSYINSDAIIIADPKRTQFPMYSTQQRLWFMEKFNGASRAYQLNTALKIHGQIDDDAFTKALTLLVNRQQSLRTIFKELDESLIQEVQPRITLPLHQHYLAHDKLPLLEQQLKTASEKKFILSSSDPLWRIDLYHITPTDNLAEGNDNDNLVDKNNLVGKDKRVKKNKCVNKDTYSIVQLCIHHIISDAWSLDIMMRELQQYYMNALSLKGQGDNIDIAQQGLSALPFQFTDFSAWSLTESAQKKWQEDIDYWSQQLSGESPILNLPTDFLRPKQQSFNGHRYRFSLPKTCIDELQAVSRKNDVTAFVPLLTAWQILLSQYSGQQDIRVGIPVANRHQAHTSQLIGYFATTQVIRSPLSSGASIASLWDALSHTLIDAQHHQSLPFENLVEVLNVPRSVSHTPLFQTLFNLIQLSTDKYQSFAGLDTQRMDVEDNTSMTDIALQIEAQDDQWQCVLEYNTDLFLPSTIERYARQFTYLLTQSLADPEKKLATLSVLDQEDKDNVEQWNNTQQFIDNEKYDFVTLFEKQVLLSPNHVAIDYQSEALSYCQLKEKTDQLAHYLLSYLDTESVREQRIAICLERSPALLIALIAVQKIGAAYIPLDPSQPTDRLAYICDHAKPSLLLTSQALSQQLIPTGNTRVLSYDDFNESVSLDHSKFEPCVDHYNPQQLAYVIYTSGSTGKPKGVAISRENLSNFLVAMDNLVPLTEQDTWLAVTTASFDISALEFYLPLLKGATVLLASERESIDGEALFGLLKRSTVFQATPASWKLLLAQHHENWPHIRGLVGGEAVPGPLVSELHEKGVSLRNVYGPTETTIWSTTHALSTEKEGVAPIGQPILNTRCYVLNQQLQEVPQGAVGELYIAGKGLARGYQFASHLTAAAFIPDPFCQDGSRMYKTGDMVSRNSEGILKYIGRSDFQIKIRGFRIELGEIESCLRRCDGVREAVVIADDKERLLAYIQLEEPEKTIDFVYLKDHLDQQLPSYMVPYGMVSVDQFPLNSNGKIDRKQLSKLPGDNQVQLQRKSSRQAETDIEKRIATIWQSLLGLDSMDALGVDDNFFELGGHSILAMQLITRVEKEFSVRLALQSLFESPTIAALAEQIALLNGEGDEDLDLMDQLLNEFEV